LRYRLAVGAVLLGMFVLFWGIREFVSFSAYQRTMLSLGIWVSGMPFSDFHAILSAAECHRLGLDVYVANPCDFARRVHIYSPLWLSIVPPSLDTSDTWWTGAILTILFLLSLAWLCPARSPRELGVFLGLCCSSAVLFAAVRANNDIIVFLLVLLAGKLSPVQRLRPIGYGAILFAAALKFYPFSALAMLVADSLRRTLLVGALALGAAFGFALMWGRDVAVAARNFPVRYMSDHFSARNLFGTLPAVSPDFAFLEPYVGILTLLAILLAVLMAVGLAIGLRRAGARLFLGFEDAVLFLAGAAMIVACFLVGHSIHYRAIHLLLTVPLLLAWIRQELPVLRLAGWVGVGLVAFAVFQSFLRANLQNIVSAVNGPTYQVSMVYWLLEEALWWCLVTGLLSAMLLIAWDSPTWLELRAMARPRVGALTKTKIFHS
jgi:hypothetical protein